MAIKVTVVGAEQAAQMLGSEKDAMRMALTRKINSLLLRLQAKIVGGLADKTYGLKGRSGAAGLAGSVQIAPAVDDGARIAGSISGGGGPTWYGGMWEQTGHKEIVPVNKKALAFMIDGKQVFAKKVSAQGPRPWMHPALVDMADTIFEELNAVPAEVQVALGASRYSSGFLGEG